ncbi:MAG: glycerol-3-phosphate acyltransferase [Oscillatoriaceae cyanobacterium Prado104]|jgi:phosphoenolpyruvate synthase/pyruvate phosphate dikinase|nr:glycerol-3-phosphate acyltransferase [Oscillatoriaceae cyanobacterium Prado104]
MYVIPKKVENTRTKFMPLGIVALLLAGSFGLGCLPLTGWMVRAIVGKDLRAAGTGNVGVSAAFVHGGKIAGIAAVLAEIARGILPVLAARICLPDAPAIAIALLVPLVAARYAIARGGGVTNAVWGVLVFSPPVAVASGISGLLAWRLVAGGWGAGRSRLFASRCGCLSTPLWVWVFRQSFSEFLAAAGLAGLLVAINLIQGDDMALSKSELLFSLDDSLDAKVCGDKAARLSQLKRAGFNVLSGLIVVQEEGRGKKEEGRGKKGEARRKKEEINRNLASGCEWLISEDLIHKIKSQISSRAIVRSSAAGEDGEISSAAGQYLTIGPVFAEAELVEAIHRCYQSYWTAEAVAYRQQRQLVDAQMAVLIQPYIDSEIAGVAFTRNPLDGGSQVIVEAVAGGAQAVVGGQVTPVHLEIDFSTPEVLENNLERSGNDSIIGKKILAELVKVARAIEDFFHGIPQDIEWSWDGEQLWILQSRPITNLQPIWTRTIAAEVIPGAIHPLTWSINQPLTCGVWGEIFRVVLGDDRANNLNFNETATLLGSHAYFNATLLGEIFRMMGLPEQGLEFLVRGQKMGKPPLGKVLPSLPGLWRLVQRERALNAEFKVDRAVIFLPALQSLEERGGEGESGRGGEGESGRVGEWESGRVGEGESGRGGEGESGRVGEGESGRGGEWENFSISNFQCPIPNYQYLSELLDRAEQIQEWLKPITYYNILGPIGLAIRKAIFRVPNEWLDNNSAPEIASVRALQLLSRKLRKAAVLQFPETVSAAELTRVFAETPALEVEFLQWLECYGYLSEVGTDIAVPTWREQPEIYQRLLVNMALEEGRRKKEEGRGKEEEERNQEEEGREKDNLAGKGNLGLSFWQRWRLDKCQERVRVKSEISEIYARLLAHLRWTFLAIEACGLSMQVFAEKGDIFYLEFGEIQEWIRSGVNVSFRDIIKERRERLAVDRTRPIPSVAYGNLLPNTQKKSGQIATKTSVMQGIPASIGIVEGVVKICRSATVELGENAIAVVPYTDAGWAPLLLGARAIVAEVGGQLSHGAIIAREYKIPAVMNVAQATTRLQDGQKVRVDGYLGTVELLEEKGS